MEILEKYKNKLLSNLPSDNENEEAYLPCCITPKILMLMQDQNINHFLRNIDNKKFKDFKEKFDEIINHLHTAVYDLNELLIDISLNLNGSTELTSTNDNMTVIMNTKIKNTYNKIFFSKYPSIFKPK